MTAELTDAPTISGTGLSVVTPSEVEGSRRGRCLPAIRTARFLDSLRSLGMTFLFGVKQ